MTDSHALLLVDDEEVICQACRRIFSRQGFTVDTNTDARQGLAQALEKDYEIILLDIKMPNMDGIQFLEQLRQTRLEVPVLIITGYPSIPNAAAAMRLGACDYVTKPFTSEEITSAVQRVLATRRIPEGNGDAGGRSGDGRVRRRVADAVLGGVLVSHGGRRFGLCRRGHARTARDDAHRGAAAADRRSGLPGAAVGQHHGAGQAAA